MAASCKQFNLRYCPPQNAILKLAQPVFARGEAKPASEAMPIYIRNRIALKTAEREQGLRL